jgi:transcriptional regulator with XRE-family HTH domain
MSRKKWSEIRDAQPQKSTTSVSRERAQRKVASELSQYSAGLAELRKARRLTQKQVSHTLGVSQAQVSRVENQTDFYLSTLRSFIEAMGGELKLLVAFPDMDAPIEVDIHDVTQTDIIDTESTPLPEMKSSRSAIFEPKWIGDPLTGDSSNFLRIIHFVDSWRKTSHMGDILRDPKTPRGDTGELKQSDVDRKFQELTSDV